MLGVYKHEEAKNEGIEIRRFNSTLVLGDNWCRVYARITSDSI